MVYCGRPSRGCQTCKTRRIKCDEKRPTCGQCQKAGRACPGYPDEFDLVLRNETSATKRKVESKKANAKSQHSPPAGKLPVTTKDQQSALRSPTVAEAAFSIQCNATSLAFYDNIRSSFRYEPQEGSILGLYYDAVSTGAPRLPSVPFGMTMSADARATAFFFRNFILLPQQAGSMRGYLEHLVPIYSNAPANSPLQLTTHAVALLVLSSFPGNAHLKPEAHMRYGQALSGVNAALRDPIESKTDETLVSVLLFGLYEAMVNYRTSSAWNKHVEGAVALVKVRGTEQLKNTQSLNLFRAVRNAMLTSCIQRGLPVGDFPDPKGWCCDEEEERNAANELTLRSLSLPGLGARARELISKAKGSNLKGKLVNIIQEAQGKDAELEDWFMTRPDPWRYKTTAIVTEIPEDLANAGRWLGEVHEYEDLFLANITNDYRISRIFCHSVILSCCRAMDLDNTNDRLMPLRMRALSTIQRMVDDICSSVPFHLHRHQVSSEQDDLTMQAIGGYFLLWPLFICSELDNVPELQRTWIRGRIRAIAEGLGLSQEEIRLMAKNHVLTSGPAFPSINDRTLITTTSWNR